MLGVNRQRGKLCRIVEKIGKLVDINFDINQIDIAHRNRQNLNANTPTLIVLFKSRTSRDNFYYKKSKLHSKSITDKLEINVNHFSCYTVNGIIYAQK